MHKHPDNVYLNGQYLPKSEACLSVEDRGTLFGDGVYEVIRYYRNRPLAMEEHLERLRQSMRGIELDEPEDVALLPVISDKLVQDNGLSDARVYWQVTRGPATRNHAVPANVQPSVLVMCYPSPTLDENASCPEWRATIVEDRRWSDCWIKSLMLLPNALARTAAQNLGCNEAVMQRQGRVTEGTSTNVFIVRKGELRTHPADRYILNGVTRRLVIRLAQEMSLNVVERACTVTEMLEADEVFLTGTTTQVAAIAQADEHTIGDGRVGEVTRSLHEAMVRHVNELTETREVQG